MVPMPKFDEQVLAEEETALETDEPSMYKVLLLNDDYTPMDFVVLVLMKVFNQDELNATRIMLDVHRKGKGVCGVYTYAVAETKVAIVRHMAEAKKYPLQCALEEE
jgi:ATP-dependent Clp protease adaptor protein ClpS